MILFLITFSFLCLAINLIFPTACFLLQTDLVLDDAFKEANIIIILWLGFPRKEGDKKDCYRVFSKLVNHGNFPEDMTSFLKELNQQLR